MTRSWLLTGALPALLLILSGGPAAADGKVYRWTDENGVVHYGDRVPPEQVSNDRDVLNDHGVPIDREQGAITPAELEVEEAERLAREQQMRELARDEILLDTYLSVGEIESLRNQRTELIDSQIQITELYLDSLRTKLGRLQQDASRFRPYSSDPDAPPIHENLAKELSNTLDSIMLYEKNLEVAEQRKQGLVNKFALDIERFKELKGLN